ncbi:hypothetical protein HPB49_008991 [Dermacentor silvarum]|uniref:Uncharacterized protein n=1 Tax=Dermacentor silvarum TaxID=543639 RepID=A0ACB8DBX7_DERSI|nr:hypothetical protein HPB49_008991 [Dermacentor silvarum]
MCFRGEGRYLVTYELLIITNWYEKDEVKEDDATAQYWKKPVGYLLEMIAKWLQKSAEGSPASYAAEDDAGLPQDATIEHIRKVAQLLNKVADAVEKGEKVDLFA